MTQMPAPVRGWHAFAESGDAAQLDDLLADDVTFRSPAVFRPQEGKVLTAGYLTAARAVLGPTLRYVTQWYAADSAALEFEADLDGTYVQGVDLLRWGSDGRITGFTVMVRPMRGLQKLVELMTVELVRERG